LPAREFSLTRAVSQTTAINAALAAADGPPLVIRPTPGWRAIDGGQLGRYRGLLYFPVWRDLQVR